MILCLDCGNSRLKWGLREGGQWAASGVLDHADIGQLRGSLPPTLRAAVGCNVAGAARAAQIEAVVGLPLRWIVAATEQCGVANDYEQPSSLGADRWAALIGARALHRGPALVVMAGTATTIDVLAADGHFRGGLILPGLDLMASALHSGTAQLSPARGEYRTLPRNTADAIASGALQATLGAMQRMRSALPDDAPCLLAGGNADLLQAHAGMPCRRIEHLVLEGLARIAAEPA